MKRKLLFQDIDDNCLSITSNGMFGFIISAEGDEDTVDTCHMTREEVLKLTADIIEFVGGDEPEEEWSTVKVACRRRDGAVLACCQGTDKDINKFYGGVRVKEVPFRVITPSAIEGLSELMEMKGKLQAQVDLTDAKITELKGC